MSIQSFLQGNGAFVPSHNAVDFANFETIASAACPSAVLTDALVTFPFVVKPTPIEIGFSNYQGYINRALDEILADLTVQKPYITASVIVYPSVDLVSFPGRVIYDFRKCIIELTVSKNTDIPQGSADYYSTAVNAFNIYFTDPSVFFPTGNQNTASTINTSSNINLAALPIAANWATNRQQVYTGLE